jgi:hypothetical protein
MNMAVAGLSLCLALAAAAGGCVLGHHRPPAARAALRATLAIGAAGMLVGLWVDLRGIGLPRLAAWCGGSLSWSWLPSHWRQLPATHAGMLLAGCCAVLARRPWQRPRRAFPAGLPCGAGMLLGMDAGAALCRNPQAGPAPLLLAMLAGMAWGMVAGEAGEAWLERHPGFRSADPRASKPGPSLARAGFRARQRLPRQGES